MTRPSRIRPSVRLRLTLLYSALFVATGAALLAVNYFLVSHHEKSGATAIQIICHSNVAFGQGGQVVGSASGQVADPATCPTPQGAVVSRVGPESIPLPNDIKALKGLVTSSQDHTLKTLALESSLALGLLTVVSLGLGWLIAGRVLRPIQRITDTARRLSQETLHERINLDGPDDELKELADTFDAMLVRLDRSFSAQRRFAANASHELRTPLAAERVLIDEALANRQAGRDELRTTLEQLRVNSQDSEDLVNALLALARSEGGVERWVEIDLATVTGQVVEHARAEAVTVGVEIRTELAPTTVVGDPALIERLVGNLVENAIRHNITPGGWVEVVTSTDDRGPALRIANTGQVLDPGMLPALFEPFRRQGGERLSRPKGLGLGLSIVTAVVTAHGARLQAAARIEGGLDLEVRLPRRPPKTRARSRSGRSPYLTATKSMTKTSVSLGPTGPLPDPP
jgi:signal transduction histidine kinase